MTPELERLVDELHDEVAPELRRLTTEAVREAARRATGEEQSVDLEHFAAAAKVHYARVAKADPHALQVPTCPAPTVSRRHPHPVYP